MDKPLYSDEDKLHFKHEFWRAGRLDWLLWPQQKLIYDRVRNFETESESIVMLCARQYGKSYLGALMAIEDCIRHRESQVLIVGPTQKQTTDIVVQSIKKIEQTSPPKIIRRSKSESRWYIGDSELIIGGFELNTATRQRGKTLANIYIEEVVDSNPDNYAEAIRSDLGPALTHSDGGKITFLTTPPKLPDHPFLTETVPEAMLHNAFFKYTIYDNHQLDEKQFEACVKRCGGIDTVEFRREYLCEVVRDENIVVVPDFDSKLHVKEFQHPVYCKYQVAIDWGGVRDKTCALLLGHNYGSDTDLVFDEFVFEPNTSLDKIMPSLRVWEEKYNVQRRIADVPGAIQVELNQTHQYIVSAPEKADWKAGVNTMNLRFSENKVLVAPHCKYLIANLGSGTFNKNKTDFERTKALGHCDGLAALMYGIRGLDRSNSYPKSGYTPDNVFFVPKPDERAIVEKKSFTVKGLRKFT